MIFYGTTFLKTWSSISGATWAQAIKQKLLHYTNGHTHFFVTKYPLDPPSHPDVIPTFRRLESIFRKLSEEICGSREDCEYKPRACNTGPAGLAVDGREFHSELWDPGFTCSGTFLPFGPRSCVG